MIAVIESTSQPVVFNCNQKQNPLEILGVAVANSIAATSWSTCRLTYLLYSCQLVCLVYKCAGAVHFWARVYVGRWNDTFQNVQLVAMPTTNFVQTSTVPRGWIAVTFVIPSLYLTISSNFSSSNTLIYDIPIRLSCRPAVCLVIISLMLLFSI